MARVKLWPLPWNLIAIGADISATDPDPDPSHLIEWPPLKLISLMLTEIRNTVCTAGGSDG